MKPQLTRLAGAVLLSTVLVSGVPGPTLAQTATETPSLSPAIGGPLANVTVVQMSVAPLSEQSRGCGFDSNLVLDSFQQPLTERGIVVQRAAHVWIQLQVTTLRYDSDICISYIEARAVQNSRYFYRKTNSARSGRVARSGAQFHAQMDDGPVGDIQGRCRKEPGASCLHLGLLHLSGRGRFPFPPPGIDSGCARAASSLSDFSNYSAFWAEAVR